MCKHIFNRDELMIMFDISGEARGEGGVSTL